MIQFTARRFGQGEEPLAHLGGEGIVAAGVEDHEAQLARRREDVADACLHFGQSLRIEFGITRLDEVKPNTPVTGRRYPAERLVLTPVAAVELINRMQQVGAALTQAGVLKPSTPAAAATATGTAPGTKTAN